jgi:hypothetical protein
MLAESEDEVAPMKSRLLLIGLLASLLASAVPGQVPSPLPGKPAGLGAPPGKPAVASAPSPADTARAAASALGLLRARPSGNSLLALAILRAQAFPAAPPSPRLTRLTQLQFDRRPSTILKAWAHRPEAKPPQGPPRDPLDIELETFQKHVTLGNWPAVKGYLGGLPLAEGKAAYKQLLQSLQGAPAGPVMMGGFPGRGMRGPVGNVMPMQHPELNAFTADDVIGLAAAAPDGLDRDLTASLGAILRRSLEGQTVASDAVARFKREVETKTGKPVLTTRQAAQVLMEAGEPVGAGTFLPGLDRAVADKDSEGLNLLARHFLGVHASEKKVVFLERAWSATQAVLALGTARAEEKEEAVRRAVELAPRIKAELGQAWLEESYTKHPERGMEILAAIGSFASQGLDTNPQMREERLKVLQLQKTAVEALLKAAPQRAAEWRSTLVLLAGAWMREADYTRQVDSGAGGGYQVVRRGRSVYRYFMGDPDMMLRQQNAPLPIHTKDLLETRPEKGWMAGLDPGPRARLAGLLAHLFLKANDEKSAFPFIEEVAPTDRAAARELINEFLRVWTAGHDPNAVAQDNDPFGYGFFSGSGGTGEGIPLTRSKQERNLVDLAGWVERMRRLPVDRLDEDLLVNAFTRCHSRAEVYRLEAIEKVFGPLAGIKPRTLANLVQSTRANLAGLWREPAEQAKKKTNRKQKDIQVEVLRGYELAGKVVGDALKQFPADWSLNLARAALLHDETNYRQEVAKSSDYSKKRAEAIANFQKAASLYADQVKKLAEDEESVAVYQQWFNASLGACDLDQIDDEKLPDPRQAPLIRKAILGLPPELAERHMNKMAEALVTNLSAVKAAARHRFLKYGFEIVGDNKKAAKAKQIFDYYKDLVNEIKLEAVIDGSDRVGHGQPFGLFVNLRHTREIERESGGFGRFLQNQNSGGYYYNFGRPTADYRDRFQAAANEALKEQFEIVSITFQTDKVHSRAVQEYAWRVTPYAYLLLKPRGPQVDKIPPLHLDLDFQDTSGDNADFGFTSGYVILPVESPAVPIDATSERGEVRPLRKLQVTQILDERQADKGKLGLEIKATGVGLVGALDDTLNLAPDGFEVVRADDQGVSVAKYDEDADDIAVVSERTWLVELRARPDRAAAPGNFRFGTARGEVAEMTYQRYQDADLAAAEQEVALEHTYEGRGRTWQWVAAGGSVVLLAILFVVGVRVVRRRPHKAVGMQLPERLTPFTVTVLLRRVRQTGRLSPADQKALDQVIDELEHRFFAADANGEEINLSTLAEDWVRKAQSSPV